MEPNQTPPKRNIGIIIGLIVLVLLATALGYYLGTRASVKEIPVESALISDTTTDLSAATPGSTATEKQYIAVGGVQCEITQKTENPYTKGEYVIATARNCGGERNWAPRFFIQNSTGTSEITKITADDFEYNNPYPILPEGKLFSFLSSSEILYASAQGEGAACQSGGGNSYVQFNYKTGAYKKVAVYGQQTSCHNPVPGTEEIYVPAQCIDAVNTYTYNGNKIGMKSTCQRTFNPTPALVEVTYNGKNILSVLAETQVDSGERGVPSKAKGIEFDPFQTTLNLLAKKDTVSFSLENTTYTLNIKTGVLTKL